MLHKFRLFFGMPDASVPTLAAAIANYGYFLQSTMFQKDIKRVLMKEQLSPDYGFPTRHENIRKLRKAQPYLGGMIDFTDQGTQCNPGLFNKQQQQQHQQQIGCC